ncbi:hypothetical protein AX16_010394 [Volvariella volvacea WC 439]|nr:hypothetical protein AX16_010394 [Volvariella volvacea WC 439]
MKLSAAVAVSISALISEASAHYTFPSLIVNGQSTPAWTNVRRTNNFETQSPVTDVKSADLRCYTSATRATAQTINVAAGSEIGFQTHGGNIYHEGVLNVYMARATNGDASTFAGDGNVWFKIHEIPAVINGGSSISWPSMGLETVKFTIPRATPSGQYLVRIEHIALHSASTYGGAQFYIACGQINVTGGGNGTPGPLVAIPGVYTGYEPGILLNIWWPIPATWTQPGPAVWRG